MSKILIVENDHFVTKMWDRKLSKTYTVEVADNVKAGILKAKDFNPDLILLDLRLNGPTSSGLQVYEFVRFDLLRETPVLFITGLEFNEELYLKAKHYTDEDISRHILSKVIKKPIEIQILVEEVQISLAGC
jgi:CheY-like chemotaxis protein